MKYPIIFFVAAYFVLSCNKPTQPGGMQGGPVPVVAQKVKTGEAAFFDTYPGTVTALNEVQLRSQVNGYVTSIQFSEGQLVKKGQKLYEIDPTKYSATYQQALASLEVAKSNLEKTRKDAERFTELGKKDAVARQRVEYAQTDFINAQQQVAAAKAQVANAGADFERAIIRAPFDGTIGISQVKAGTFVTAGQTILNTVSTDDPMTVDFVISEKEIARFNEIKKVAEKSKDTAFSIAFGNIQYKYPGKIFAFDRAVDPQTGTLKIRLNFPNPEKDLRSGMSCLVRVHGKSGNQAIVVPSKAIVEQMGEFFVYVLKQDTARQNKVQLGPNLGHTTIIREGLKPEDIIIVEGLQKLKEGVPVDTASRPAQNAGPAAAAGNQKK